MVNLTRGRNQAAGCQESHSPGLNPEVSVSLTLTTADEMLVGRRVTAAVLAAANAAVACANYAVAAWHSGGGQPPMAVALHRLQDGAPAPPLQQLII